MLDLAAHQSNTGPLQVEAPVLTKHNMSGRTVPSAAKPRQYLPAAGRICRAVTGGQSFQGLGSLLAGIGICHQPVATAADRSLTRTGMLAGVNGADGLTWSASARRGAPA